MHARCSGMDIPCEVERLPQVYLTTTLRKPDRRVKNCADKQRLRVSVAGQKTSSQRRREVCHSIRPTPLEGRGNARRSEDTARFEKSCSSRTGQCCNPGIPDGCGD